MRRLLYPFSAIVEQNALKTALIINAVDPSIGGVLIQGHKGTGKSTAVRALAQLLPDIEVVEDSPFNSDPQDPLSRHGVEFVSGGQSTGQTVMRPMPFVELPLNATEDRLVGSLHIEKALQAGERRFEPGLLAAANRGILYVDEVNLLPDHLVDMLLDSAASGINIIEREGISFVHPARFILIGTMNPEEGELRPQFLDRFGLCVAIRSVVDLDARKAIVQRHMAFENNPGRFLDEWAQADETISNQIAYARNHLDSPSISDNLMTAIVRLTRDLQLQGHRADITIYKAARAHAALLEKSKIENPDVVEAARLALPHRMMRSALDRPEVLREKIEEALHDVLGADPAVKKNDSDPLEIDPEDMAERMQVPGDAAAGSLLFSFLGKKHAEVVVEADTVIAASAIDVENLLAKNSKGKGKSGPAISGRTGRHLRAEPVAPGDRDYHIAVGATLRQAAVRSAREEAGHKGGVPVTHDDLRKKRLVKPRDNLIVFVVDASGSMSSQAQKPMKAAKGAVLAILHKARQIRSKAALIAFGGQTSTLVLAPTSSLAIARSALETLPAGGATPFADSLLRAWQLIRSERLKNPRLRPILVIISDGEANITVTPGAEPLEELQSLARKIALDRIPAIFIDAAVQDKGESEMKRIAGIMEASFLAVGDLTPDSVLQAVVSHELHE
ncbi:MAG: VWA domain-containing protein [Acidobacteria bacterium]|nr:VWA domain-containing protein [Acidobacteriota bacterium]